MISRQWFLTVNYNNSILVVLMVVDIWQQKQQTCWGEEKKQMIAIYIYIYPLHEIHLVETINDVVFCRVI